MPKSSPEDAMNDASFEEPTPISKCWFADLTGRVAAVKSDIEEEMDEEYKTFTPTFFLKRNFRYKIKVDIGNDMCIHVTIEKGILMDVEKHRLTDPMGAL